MSKQKCIKLSSKISRDSDESLRYWTRTEHLKAWTP